MLVSSCGVTFSCRVESCGEHYRIGRPKTVTPSEFGVPVHGDYPGTARIDWETAIPDILQTGLEQAPELLGVWRSLSCQEMRAHLSQIFRAQRPGVIAERQFAVLRALSGAVK